MFFISNASFTYFPSSVLNEKWDWHSSFRMKGPLCPLKEVALKEGDIGEYPIPQYRKKKWQIPKYRVENRLNTDTAYINLIHNRFRILMEASI